MQKNNFDVGLEKKEANFVQLSPLTFLERTKDVFPNHEALVYHNRSYTWLEVYNRCIKFSSALTKYGIVKGNTVSVMAANTPELFELHYSIPMSGAVINTINTRLDVNTVAYILDHSDAKVLVVDRQFAAVVSEAIKKIDKKIYVIEIDDKNFNYTNDKSIKDIS